MKNENTERIRARILSLIESEYESDAAFERELGIPDKTVNNWRRGRSASFMKILPELAEALSVTVADLLDLPISEGVVELSAEEREIIALYRRAKVLSPEQREALNKTLGAVINMYIDCLPKKPRAASRAKKK